MAELLPCPFCASEVEVVRGHTAEGIDWIRHLSRPGMCGLETFGNFSADEPVDALWNRRADLAASEVQTAREEALREAARLVEGVSTWFTTDDHARDCAADIRALATPPAENGEPESVGCSDCPPPGYPTDATRCDPCPRRATPPADPADPGGQDGE